MKRFLDLLRSPKPSSTDLRTALAANDVTSAEAEHASLVTQRAALLMEGDDKTLDALEARIAATRRQVERATIVQEQLTASLAQAEAREAAEVLTAERDRTEAEAVAVAKAIKVQYPKLASELCALLERLAASERAVVAMNHRLYEAGRGDEALKSVETRAFPLGPHQYGPERSLQARTALASIPNQCPGWFDPLVKSQGMGSGYLPVDPASAASISGQ